MSSYSFLAGATASSQLALVMLRVFRLKLKPYSNRAWLVALCMTVCIHGYLLYRWIDTDMGQNLSLPNLFSFVAWLITCQTVILSCCRPLVDLNILALPLASTSILMVMLSGTNIAPSSIEPLKPGHLSHILLSLAALSLAGLTACQAILFNLQRLSLKNNKIGTWTDILPPLDTMERQLFSLIWLSFFTLTIALVSAIYNINMAELRQYSGKIALSICAWLSFATIIIMHYYKGWRGRKAVLYSVMSSFILATAYFGIKLVTI